MPLKKICKCGKIIEYTESMCDKCKAKGQEKRKENWFVKYL